MREATSFILSSEAGSIRSRPRRERTKLSFLNEEFSQRRDRANRTASDEADDGMGEIGVFEGFDFVLSKFEVDCRHRIVDVMGLGRADDW